MIASFLCASNATDHFSKVVSDIKYSSQEQDKELRYFSITIPAINLRLSFFLKKKYCYYLLTFIIIIKPVPIHLIAR